MSLKNTQIVDELNLPPVKIHCSVLAEDAIKAAIADYKAKRASGGGALTTGAAGGSTTGADKSHQRSQGAGGTLAG